jgi:predicted kinase
MMALVLIALAGLPGVGKSTFARALGRSLRAPVLSVDPIEAALLRSGIDRAQPTGLAAYVVAAALAERQLEIGLTTIVDAANYVEPGRQMWRELAAQRSVPLRWIELLCSDEAAHRARLEARGAYIPGFHVVTWADVLRRRAETEPWTDERLVVDTAAPIEDLVARALAYLSP